MKRFERKLRRYVEETTATPSAVRRVDARLETEFGEAGSTHDELLDLPGAPPGAEQRLRRRLAHVPRRSPARRPVLVLGTALAVAALLVGALLLVQPGSEDTPTPSADASLATTLESADGWADATPTEDVALRFQGSGELTGTAAAPRVQWRSGSLDVDVEPGRGIDLQVRTRDATVRVVGTAFTVDRSVLGTEVTVRHGRVHVVCDTGHEQFVSAGEVAVCVPATAVGLRARA